MTKRSANLSKSSDKPQKASVDKHQIPILGFLKYSSGVDYLYFIIGFIGGIFSGVGWPGLNILYGKVVDHFVQFEIDRNNAIKHNETITEIVSEFSRKTNIMAAIMVCITVVFILGNYTAIHCFQMFALRQMRQIKKLYFQSILKQEVAWFDGQNSGEFASRISSDFKKFEGAINENLGLLLYYLSTSALNLIIGLVFGWKLSLVIIAMSPIIGISSFIMTRLQSRYMQRELQASSNASTVAEEAISSIRTVFAFGGQDKERHRYEKLLRPAMNFGCKRNVATAIGTSMTWATLYGSIALGIWYGVTLILDPTENYKLGDVVVVFWAIISTGLNIGSAAPYFESFQIGRTAAAGIYRILERTSLIDSSSPTGSRLKEDFKTNIELKNVHFSYPTRQEVSILNGLNLKINSGEIVALVGQSGCGKSTIIQLIQRFYEPSAGDVLLDGVNLKELNVEWLRQQIGVVGQEPILFDASIEENIRLGANHKEMSNIKMEDIVEAAKEANAHDFISGLQDGYNTYVGDRGAQLSGGQKQRIAIARALISKPKILLLDEATSALDLQSETVVQAALDRASHGRTTIIVAHRLSTIINANRIIFLDGGRVLEMGNHEELMKRKSAYYNLVCAQQVSGNSQTKKLIRPGPLNEVQIIASRHSSTVGSSRSSIIVQETASYLGLDEVEESVNAELINKKFAYKRIGQLIWADKCYFFIALIAAVLYGTVTPIYALIFGSFVDEFTTGADDETLLAHTIHYSIYYVCLAIGVFLCNSSQISLFGIVGEKLTMKLRNAAFSAILNQEIAWFDEPHNSAGSLCSRLANDAANVQGATGLRVAMMCQAISTLVCCVLLGFLYNWRLACGGLLLMPLVALSTVASSKLYSGQAKQDGKTAQLSSKILIEVMNAVRTVVSLHKQQYFFEKFTATLNEHFNAIHKKIFFKALIISVALGIPFFAYSVSFIFGGYLLSINYLRSGDFFRIIESMVFGAIVIGQTAILSSDFAKAKLAAVNIFNLIDRKPLKLLSESDDTQVTVEKSANDRSQGNISFRGIYFHYPSRPDSSILNGLSFSAQKGETVALVGSSGCGKSTTIQLLEQFYECIKGKINLDGENISKLSTSWVRSQMSLVSQEPILFSYSIKDNIAYGDNARTVPFEEIVKAAQMANVHDFVQKLPLGYDTPVGSKGTQLSGGQKQRIAIARALVRDPSILLLDEATSALDTESEKVVQMALEKASEGRTCLVIAHRLKTIVNAHKIVVLNRGQNIEEGTHEELIAKKGFYWNLYNSAVSN